MISKLVEGRVLATSHGGTIRGGKPKVIVVHSTETPIQNGRAYQSAAYVKAKGLSAHYFVDPGEIIAGLDETLIGWGAGTVNAIACHVEFTGCARYSRTQWLKGDTEPGIDMIDRGAKLIADIASRNSVPLRMLTDAQLAAAWRGTGPGGITTHAQCARVIGGTDHWDPGTGFPLDLLLQEDDMPYTEKQLKSIVADAIKAEVPKIVKAEVAAALKTADPVTAARAAQLTGYVLRGGDGRPNLQDITDRLAAVKGTQK